MISYLTLTYHTQDILLSMGKVSFQYDRAGKMFVCPVFAYVTVLQKYFTDLP